MEEKLEQRINIKFCVKLKKTRTETFKMLQAAYGEKCLSLPQTFRWFNRFKSGESCVKDLARSGRPADVRTFANISRVRGMINSNRRLTIREISEDLKINQKTVNQILTKDLKMKRVGSTLVPRILTEGQKQNRVKISQDMLSMVCTDEELFSKIITTDESWVYGYDPETNRMSTQWTYPGEQKPQKAKRSKSKIKSMLLLFWDIEGIVHEEYLTPGFTVTAQYYIMVLHRVIESVKLKRPSKAANGWILHQDNASPHTAHITDTFLWINNIQLLPQPPYSPDLAPSDFWIFFRIKKTMKGRRFSTIEEIQTNTRIALDSIGKEEFKQCFQSTWIKRWKKCILSGGEYFERDNHIVNCFHNGRRGVN